MISMNPCHFRKLSDVDIAQEKVMNKILNNIAENYGVMDYFYLGCIAVLKNMLDTECPINKEMVIEYLKALKDIREVSTEVKGVIDAVIKEYEELEKNKDNLKKE